MSTTHLVKGTLITLAGIGLIAINCTGQFGNNWADDDTDWSDDTGGGDNTGGGGPRETPPACDPDGVAPCPDDYFICFETEGGKRCEGQNPATPDDGAWDCYQDGTTIICRGDHMPPDDGFWDCEELGDSVVCRGHGYVPIGEGDEDWNCWYEGSRRVCEEGGGASAPGDSGGETDTDGSPESGDDSGSDMWDDWFPDNDGDGLPDDLEDLFDDLIDDLLDGIFGGGNHGDDNPGDDTPGDDTPGDDTPGDDTPDEGCLCVPGAWRYCDTPTYCRWGVQYCEPDGMSWGRCDEVGAIPASCADYGWYSREAEECCIESGFCCQDFGDLDLDGNTWESLGACEDIVCE
jgi:hypothetical protein